MPEDETQGWGAVFMQPKAQWLPHRECFVHRVCGATGSAIWGYLFQVQQLEVQMASQLYLENGHRTHTSLHTHIFLLPILGKRLCQSILKHFSSDWEMGHQLSYMPWKDNGDNVKTL